MRPRRTGSGLPADDLTDAEWRLILPLLPKARGIPRIDDRRTLNGILHRLRTGRSWMSIPPAYGNPSTCRSRFNRWRDAGVWDRIVAAVMQAQDGRVEPITAAAANVLPCWRNRPPSMDVIGWIAVPVEAERQVA